MANPTISVINFSSDLEDRAVQHAIRAVNRQMTEDFSAVWGTAWELRLHSSAADPTDPDSLEDEAVRGEGVLYLVDESTLPGALGFHGWRLVVGGFDLAIEVLLVKSTTRSLT